MALVTMKELLERAKNNHRGIGAFSVGNMEMVKGAIQAAEELDTPIILQIAEVRLKHSPLALMGPMMVQAAKRGKSGCGSTSGSRTYDGDGRESTGTWIYIRHVRQFYISI